MNVYGVYVLQLLLVRLHTGALSMHAFEAATALLIIYVMIGVQPPCVGIEDKIGVQTIDDMTNK